MTKNFPHISDNPAFPGLGDPYAQGDFAFDYNRWQEGTKIILCRVPWDAANNVVDWTRTNPKDYFDSLQDINKITLNTEINIQPDGAVRLPVPIANVQRYNYLWVELEPMTSVSQPLDYSEGDALRKIGYFMRDAVQITPSTTECHIDIDWWTNSIPYTQVSYMTLERGHAPLAAVSADDYLKDPLHHNQYLLTEDVNYGEPVITKHSQLEMWTATTEPLVCFALTCSLEQLAAMLEQKPTDQTEWTDPEFSDTDDRWGKQWQVNGYEWGDSDKYKNSTTESSPWLTGTGLPGYTLIAVNSTDADDFLNYVQENAPQIMQLIKTSFAVPGMMLSTKEAGKAGDVAYYQVLPLNQLPPVPVELHKEDFGYPKELAEIAKLYTSPYAKLTFSDNNGDSVDVRIECTSGLKIDRRVSMAFPYLKAQAFLEGVNGTGSNSLTWVDVNGLEHDSSMPATNWQETMLEFSIPTYALVADGYRQWLLKHSRENEAKRIEALNSYHNTVRSGNTGTENTKDSLATSLKNTLRSNETALENGTRSNETGNTNTLASLTTGNTNTLASNQLALDNGNRSNETGNTNAIASIENSFNNTNASLDTERHNSLRSNETGYKNTLASADTSYANEKAAAATALSNATASAGTAYQNAENTITTGYQNTKNSADTGLSNALSSNTTGYSNALASSATAKANADRSADASVTATANSNATNQEMVTLENNYATSTNDLAKGFADANFANRMQKMKTTIGDETDTDITKIFPNWNVKEFPSPAALENALFDAIASLNSDEATRIVDMLYLDPKAVKSLNSTTGGTSSNMILAKGTLQGAEAAIASGWNKFKNLAQLGLTAVTSVASAAGAAEVAPTGGYASYNRAVVQPAIDATETIAPTMISVTGDQAIFKNQSSVNTTIMAASIYGNQRGVRIAEKLDGAQLTLTKSNMDSSLKLSNQLNVDKNTKQRDLATKQTALSAGTSKANAAASQATANSNALASKKNADANANNSYKTTLKNAGNSKETALTNAENNKNRTVENAQASNATTLANAKRSNDLAHANADRSYKTAIDNIESTYKTNNFINDANRKTSTDNQARSYTTTKTNLAASKNVADANANRSYTTGTENQGRSYNTTSTNLQASKTTADANANDSNNTSVANAVYSQDTAISVAQNNLKTTQAVAKLAVDSHKNDATVTVGETTGDPIPDLFGTRGVQVRVQTQPEGAIRSAGSQFLRYGYRLDQAWQFTKWSVMSRFSYWQAKDVWLTGETSIAELGKDAIRAILAQGVTVWASPEIVCTGSTSDNKPLA